MNKEIKAKWIAALTSGEYTQGKDYLNRNGKFCCLGVLCDLYRKETGMGEWIVAGGDGLNAFVTPNDQEYFPAISESIRLTHLDVVAWSDIGDRNPAGLPMKGISECRTASLASLNDCGIPFGDIAKLIEEYL